MKVGIIGAGQLARMLAIAAKPLDIQCYCVAASETDSAAGVSTLSVIDLNVDALTDFAKTVDVITFENENVDVDLVVQLEKIVPIFPGLSAIRMSQDRLIEKECLEELGIEVAPYREVTTASDLRDAVAELGLPAILKTRRFGYDGKGQFVLRTQDDVENALLACCDIPMILEAFLEFDCEVSIVAARAKTGEIQYYPLAENEHVDGILRVSKVESAIPTLQAQAEAKMKTLMGALDYVGVLAIEFFVQGDKLIANEFAPRVHNTGHWTIEGAKTSQFENHIRAVCGLPLGETALLQPTTMINCIGEMPLKDSIPEGAYLHDYQKTPRPNRKVGHITVVADV